jgi:hypothetical protein
LERGEGLGARRKKKEERSKKKEERRLREKTKDVGRKTKDRTREQETRRRRARPGKNSNGIAWTTALRRGVRARRKDW